MAMHSERGVNAAGEQDSAPSLLSLPYEIRHIVYAFICPPVTVRVTIYRKRVKFSIEYLHPPLEECGKEITNQHILNILQTCKQVNLEFTQLLYSKNLFSLCIDGSYNLLDVRRLGEASIKTIRRLRLTFKPTDPYRPFDLPRDLFNLLYNTRRYNFNRKRPAQDALFAWMLAELDQLDLVFWAPLIHNRRAIDLYQQWLRSIEPTIKAMGHCVSDRATLRIFCGERDVCSRPAKEMVGRHFVQGYEVLAMRC